MSVADFTMREVFGAARITGILVSVTCSAADRGEAEMKYVSDMRRCVPTSALSEQREQGRWQLISYQTDELSGTMIGAASFINAPDVTLPLDVSGWQAVYVGYWNPYFAYEGLDVGGWIKEGLLDSIVCQEGIDNEYIALGKSHHCKFILFTGYRGAKAMSPKTIADAYRAGVTDFAYWDMDCVQDVPEAWEWIRRVGHRDEMEAWENRTPTSQWIRLKTIGGVNVHPGLQQAAYSGG